MAAAPDTLLYTGQTLGQIFPGAIRITPTGLPQTTLNAIALAAFANTSPATTYYFGADPAYSSTLDGNGGYSTIVGRNAALGIDLSTAVETTTLGWLAGGSGGAGMTGSENTLGGWHSGYKMTTGNGNSAWGVNTMGQETTGTGNVAVGVDCQRDSVGNVSTTSVGGQSTRNGQWLASVLIGNSAGKGDSGTVTVANDVIAIGLSAIGGTLHTTGSTTIGIGTRSLFSITTASNNVFGGYEGGTNITTGQTNVGWGNLTLHTLISGNGNSAFGHRAGYTTTGSQCAYFGQFAGDGPTGSNNTGIGNSALSASGALSNSVGIGNSVAPLATGTKVVAIGPSVAATLTSGSNVILIGTGTYATTPTATTSNFFGIFGSSTAIISATAIDTATPVVTIPGSMAFTGTTIGFYSTSPVARPTGVAITAAGIHAALVTLGLITA